MADINQKFDIWKNKLLDMGKRNNLLNYHDTKRGSLQIKIPAIYDLWDSFVIKEQPIEFPYAEDIDDEAAEDNALSDQNSIITNQSVNEQQKTLRNLRNKSKTFMEEQGINVLYLSFGFVSWTEAAHSKQYFEAPLVLVPVSISWESITSPFVLTLHEDEIITNPTLSYKMHTDFGIELPDFDTDSSLSDYFDTVKELIVKNNWDIVPIVKLGLLSFLKINMYHDLEAHSADILKHPVIKAIAGNSSDIDNDLSMLDNFDHDSECVPSDVFQIVDADSSQQDAILCAKRGMSFILQGPPGTGKSQTITNIIAECLADGKKVLFVSEKMAALEVVHKRLNNAGLDDFCLIMHSHKANKKETLEQLERVLNLSQTKANINDEAYQKLTELEKDRRKLNTYSNDVFKNILPLNKTIYEANGYLASLQSYADIVFSVDNIRQISFEQYIEFLNVLEQLKNTVSNKSTDFTANPWYSANVKFVSNELRHNINAKVQSLVAKSCKISELENELSDKLSISYKVSYAELAKLIKILALAGSSPKVPVFWMTDENVDSLLKEVDKCNKSKEHFITAKEKLRDTNNRISQKGGPHFSVCADIVTLDDLNRSADELRLYVKSNAVYNLWWNDNFESIYEIISAGMKLIIEYNEAKNQLLNLYEKEILNIDYNSIYMRFKTEYQSIFRVFNSTYRKDKKLFAALYRESVKSLSDEEILSAISTLKDMEEIKSELNQKDKRLQNVLKDLYCAENTDIHEVRQKVEMYRLLREYGDILKELRTLLSENSKSETALKCHYESMYSGLDTDWNKIREALHWTATIKSELEFIPDNTEFAKLLCISDESILLCKTLTVSISDAINNFNTDFEWFLNLFENKECLTNLKITELTERIKQCGNNLSLLEKWIDYRNIRDKCVDIGLGDFIKKLEEQPIDSDDIIHVFQKRFFSLWIDSVIAELPAVANFRRKNQENLINNFCRLDKLQFDIAQARIRSKLIDSLPSAMHFTNGSDEISILKREISKQRRIMPIRKLFKQIPDLILRLKPCLMMSPLSVSLFLEADSFKFDTVIFDEASQVCTENAIGAIFRGKQVIIAGDSKQLPPTSFFSTGVSGGGFDDSDNDEDEPYSYDSILDEAALLPERTLLWHYRSRHEHLIAFSNTKIYKKQLVTFPSNVDRMPDYGVEYYYVANGFYDRGGKKGNIIEAQKVADMVFEHFSRFGSKRSLGVIAFGEVQRLAIDTAIRKKRMENQQFEEFFNEDLKEPFFVKSLENVQGDERDTIIFSIGYARDAAGNIYMQFGPLSQSGGERRLNVAITRAKYNVKLVGSIVPTDINIDKISSEGPKLLRSYIEFAMNGPVVLENEITDNNEIQHDSPFEESVYKFLEEKGYKLSTQVGCSGYRIDMAIKHPDISGRYVLGIECDGASYHSARTARERDRLRQDVLESMGWKIYRIWSTDWIKDPVTEGKLLIEAVEKAINHYIEEPPSNVFNEYETDNKTNGFITVEAKEISLEDTENPYGFDDIKETNFNSIPKDRYGNINLSECILQLVKNEYPIHYDLICQKICPVLDREKVTSIVKREVDSALSKLSGRIEKKKDFYYPSAYTTVPARKCNGRSIKYISIDELSSAMLRVAEKCVGATREGIIEETTRAYGFSRRGVNITTAMNEAYQHLLKSKAIFEIDGKVSISK